MLINTPPCISTVVRIGALVVFLLTAGSYFLPRKYEVLPVFDIPILRQANITETSSTFNASVVEFWQDLASALLDATPQCKPLKVLNEHMHTADTRFDPLDTERKAPERLVDFTEKEETALFRAHYAMRISAQRLAPRLPFAPGTTGIVTTANGKYMPVLLVSLRMLRRTGCTLPVQVFIDDWATYDSSTCDILLPSLNARCVVLSEIYSQSNNSDLNPPQHYQYKPLAILFSSFENVLFLDSDAFPAYDPTILFSTPPYTTHGLVTWPDYFALTISRHYYHIASIPPAPISSRLSTESGIILLQKSLHAPSLLLSLYYNYFGPEYYYPLLCQGSHGAGDKETFVQAALAVGLPYYQVRTAPVSLGRWWNGTYRGVGMAQADPGIDWEYGAPHPNHIHPSGHWEKLDAAHPDPVIEKQLNRTRYAKPPPRPAFIHQNTLKLNPSKLLRNQQDITFEPDGTPYRMWGLKEDVEKVLGYDVERRLWNVIAEEACRLDVLEKGGEEERETCKRVREYVGEVIGWMESIDRPW